MATKLDRSDASGVLVTCTDCPYWFAFAWTDADAHDSACAHEERVHPGRNEASTKRAHFRAYAARHAV
ncbi:MAG: hypothetical protein CMF56_01260 [Leifsonia sp.]|nr:hypothetical protein [Leifsonia sp.]|tara:strand:- start:29356 stop:29559 length:204 start_codon:yes stop_codon:yes gene_type:complete